ncbi:MAG: N-6 DNA methylase [Deltaproteobacteria bacterium]|nr:N-6 DNA methylase [Deltaproteobacteria bacterium]
MVPPDIIRQLVSRLEENLADYKSGNYKETQLRREFLDPFFKSLGWDIDNEQGYAEAYKDVIHEDAIRVGGMTKAPDYCFRIGGARKFFLEAKKPSVDIKRNVGPAFQLRRYAWSAKLPLSILSDFDEFAVYDCRVKPSKDDPAATARIFICNYREYEEKWDWIAERFSRDAVLKGSFDKFAESKKGKKGTAEVDAAFLAEIEGWRIELARNLALRNPRLTQRELNFSVQRIIDRIIFLRICEDRGIEDYGRLQALVSGGRVYPRLCELFTAADARYNSGLFHFETEKNRHEAPDELTLTLELDDKVLRDILSSLYYPDSPYEFSVLSADILGQVYEQFLGKVIRLTEGHRAVVDDKPEVKKAGGVYYTPTYIVDYIVRNTVEKLVEKKTPKQVSTLRVLDPACGSGSFLIGAYQYLLDWHLEWYSKNDPKKWVKGKSPALYQNSIGYKLTVAERKRILLNNIYGVDIDSQAVEVTKLSLLLKVLEGETEQSIQTTLKFLRERALPDLGDNIKCGNSLIGPDFYRQTELPFLGEEERYRINVFDWQAEFPKIFKAGGFDVVIGNPPYLNIDDTWGKGDVQLKAIKLQYPHVYNDKTDILFYFIAKAYEISKDRVGFIVSRAFLEAFKANKLRGFLATKRAVSKIVDFRNFQVFKGVGITTCVLQIEKGERLNTVLSVYRLVLEELPSRPI